MKVSLAKDYQTSKIRKKRINYWIHLLGLSTLLSIFPANKALSSYPSLYPITTLLNSSYAQCKTKANEVANLVFSEVQPIPEKNSYFQLFGIAPRTVSVLICVRSNKSTYFIFSTSGGFADTRDEAKLMHQRVYQYMLGN